MKSLLAKVLLSIGIIFSVVSVVNTNTEDYVRRLEKMRTIVEERIEEDVKNYVMSETTERLVEEYNKMVSASRLIWWEEIDAVPVYYGIDLYK